MALTTIERVRARISDKPKLYRERVTADGVSDRFKLKFEAVNALPVPQVWKNDTIQVEGTDYTVDYDHGIIIFGTSPVANDKVVIQYYSTVWTDEEIEDFVDQYGDIVNVAAGHLLLAWSADVAKLAKRETLSGGGGVGAVTRDTSVAARELRNSAKALLDWEAEYGETTGTGVPAEGVTEVPWTEAAFYETEDQRLIRES